MQFAHAFRCLLEDGYLFLCLLVLSVISGENEFGEHLVFFHGGADLHVDFRKRVSHLRDGVGLLHALDGAAELAHVGDFCRGGLYDLGGLALFGLDLLNGGCLLFGAFIFFLEVATREKKRECGCCDDCFR